MTTRETHRSLPETWKNFDPSNFYAGDEVAYHDPNTNTWQKGQLATTPPIIDRDNRRIYLENTGTGGIELRIPPKKVDKKVLDKTVEISIEDAPGSHTLVEYEVQRDAAGERLWNIGPDGEIEVTLVPVNPGRNHKEISNVNLDTLKNYQEVEEVESQVDAQINALRVQIDGIANIRRKELLSKLMELDKKVHQLVEQTGHFDELGDLEPKQIKAVAGQIKELRRAAEEGAREIESTMRKVNTEIGNRGVGDAGKKRAAAGLTTRIDRLHTDNEKAYTDFKAEEAKARLHARWRSENAIWEREEAAFQATHAAWVAAGGVPGAPAPAGGGGGRGAGAAAPAGPGREPAFTKPRPVEPERPVGFDPANPAAYVEPADPSASQSRDKAINAYEILQNIRNGVVARTVAGPGGVLVPDPAFQSHREMVAETDRRLNERKANEGLATTDSYNTPTSPNLEEKITGEIFLAVLDEWNQREVRPEMNFDFAKEQTELKNKIAELLKDADEKALNSRAMEAHANSLRANLNTLNSYTKGTANVETLLADMWGQIGRTEVELFKEKNRTTGRSEQEKNIDVDIPHTVLMDIFATRPAEVYGVMSEAYNNQGSNMRGAIEAALRRVFEPSPTQNGPRVNGNLQANEAMVARLRQYGIKDWRHFKKLWDEKLAPRAAVMMHEWAQDDVRNEAARNSSAWDKAWAMRGQIAARVGLNVLLVGGGALAVGAAIGTGGLGAAALGGALGGGIRAGLQKFIFGQEKFEKRKEQVLKELEDRQREQAIEVLLARRFGRNHQTNPNFEQDSLRMFSTMLAQAAREASAEFVAKDDVVKSVGLSGDSRRLYIQAIKDIENGGDVPSERQKMACAVAIKKLQEHSVHSIQEAAEGDPMVIRMLDGIMSGYSGRSASKENYGLKGATGTVALGATVGAAFMANSTWARATLGGIGGAVAGYHFAESRFNRAELEDAREEAQGLYDEAARNIEDILRAREAGTPVGQADLVEATNQVQRLNRLLHGNADTLEDKHVAHLLATPNEKRLRKEIENLVYQAYRRGIFVQRALGEIENHSRAATESDRIDSAQKTNAWFRKNGVRALGVIGGAALGAVSAVVLGRGFQEMGKHAKEAMGFGAHGPIEKPIIHPKGWTPKMEAAGAVATGGAVVAEAAPAPVVPAEPTIRAVEVPAVVESAPTHEAGLFAVENPNAVHNVNQWRHQIMEKMGYVFHGKKIDHALLFHKGAEIELVNSKGEVVDSFTFRKGDSTWRALDHLQHKAAGLIKHGEIPSIKIVGAEDGKVEILDHYKVETHGAKTNFVEGKAIPAKNLPADNFKEAPLAKTSLNAQNLRHADQWSESGDLIKGKNGAVYSTMYPDSDNPLVTGHAHDIPGHHIRYVDVQNNIYDSQGKYVGHLEHRAGNVATKSTAGFEPKGKGVSGGGAGSEGGAKSPGVSDKIKWSEGKNLNKNEFQRLDNLLHGSKSSGGGVAENTVGRKVSGTTIEAPAKSAGVEATATKGARVDTATAVSPSSAETQVDASANIPTALKTQYTEWAEVKQNFAQSYLSDLDTTIEDKANLMPRFLDKVELAFKQNPELLKDADIQKVLDNARMPAGDKLNTLAVVMGEKNLISLSPEEQLIIGDIDRIPADSEDFEKFTITRNGKEFVVAVAKGEGSHVVVYKNAQDGRVFVQTDPNKLFSRASMVRVPRAA